MEKKYLLWIATKAADKGWDYVVELKEIGTKAFYAKYKEFKLY